MRTNTLLGPLVLLVVAAMPVAAQDKKVDAPKPIRVLFVGNSQFYFNNLHKIVEALAESAPKNRPRIVADAKPSDRAIAGGATLESHWKKGTGQDTARGKIAGEKWDFVILQDYSGVTSKENFTEYAKLFDALIRENGAKTVLFSTSHLANRVPKGFLDVHERHVTVGNTLQAPVAAGGKAWLAYWGDNPTEKQILDLYHADKGHPGPRGSYLYACTLYSILTGHSPVGLTHRIPGQPETTITSADAKRFQEAAWQVHQEVNGKKPVQVFILAGQSNMEGQAVVDLDGKNYNDGKGTLKALMNDPAKASLFKHLKNAKGNWTVRDDVWVRYQREKQPLLAGPLSIGFSIYASTSGKHHFGPELQFGHIVGDHLRSQILLIKTAWGGKSLYKDFRPPSSGGEVGPYYKKMLAEVRLGLDNLKTDFPAYQGQGYELAGFVWYHGWNDGVDPKNAVPQYEENLVNLIKDVRKDLSAPQLPVVIGELTGPWVDAPGAWATLRKAQARAANRPEFKGNVIFVETRQFVRPAKESPNPGHGHHEFGNAETYFLVGDALGKGMAKLLTPRAK